MAYRGLDAVRRSARSQVTHTSQNACFARPVMPAGSARSITIVSMPPHLGQALDLLVIGELST